MTPGFNSVWAKSRAAFDHQVFFGQLEMHGSRLFLIRCFRENAAFPTGKGRILCGQTYGFERYSKGWRSVTKAGFQHCVSLLCPFMTLKVSALEPTCGLLSDSTRSVNTRVFRLQLTDGTYLLAKQSGQHCYRFGQHRHLPFE